MWNVFGGFKRRSRFPIRGYLLPLSHKGWLLLLAVPQTIKMIPLYIKIASC